MEPGPAFTPGGQRVSDTESFPNYDACEKPMKVVHEAHALCKKLDEHFHPFLKYETKDLCNAVDMQREH